jgi:hypothetical protein
MIAASLLGILVLLPSPAAAEDGVGPNSLPSVGNHQSVVRIEYPVEISGLQNRPANAGRFAIKGISP